MRKFQMPKIPEPSTTAGVFSAPALSTHEGSGESDTDFPLISMEGAMSSSSSGSTERTEETEQVEEIWWMEESVGTEPILTPNTTLQSLESFPVVASQDLPAGHHDCPIC